MTALENIEPTPRDVIARGRLSQVPQHPQPAAPAELPRVAVLVPCYNEARTIANVVREIRAELPEAHVYVFDNNSTDDTAGQARQAGAIVRFEPRQGKGFVIRSMFKQVNADIYVMIDGDGTYPAAKIHDLIAPLVAGEADVAIGSRLLGDPGAFRTLNLVGNWVFRTLLNHLFRVRVTDVLSGYRAMTREVVKTLPLVSRGFESETELTVKCLERGFRTVEVPVELSARHPESRSKIRIWRDGVLILNTIFALMRDYQPLRAFGFLGLILIGLGLVPGFWVVREYLATGLILRIPSAILAVGLVLSGLLVAFAGLVLHSIARRFQELEYHTSELLARQWSARIGSGEAADRE